MAIKEYEPGTAFPGVMGRTIGESQPAWPQPLRAKRFSERALHRPRRHRLRAARLLRLADRHADLDRLAASGLRYNNMHTTALCSPSALVHADRAQPPLAMRWRASPRRRPASPAKREHPVRERLLVRDAAARTATTRLRVGKWHLTPPEQMQRGRARTTAGRSGAASSASTGSWAATPTSTTPTSSTTTTRSSRRRRPRTATT